MIRKEAPPAQLGRQPLQSLRRHRREEEKESFVRPAQKHESLENHQKISKIRKSAKSGSSSQK